MKTLAQKYADGLCDVTRDLEKKDAAAAIRTFVDLLAKRGRLRLAPAILAAFERRAAAEDGAAAIRLTTAVPLADRAVKELRAELEKRLERRTVLETSVDPGIPGGAIIRFDDTRLDASLKRRLERLNRQLAD